MVIFRGYVSHNQRVYIDISDLIYNSDIDIIVIMYISDMIYDIIYNYWLSL